MQLVGQSISHIKFGKGVVSDATDETITIIFQHGEKKFLFPDAFENFLVLRNTDEQNQINEMVTTLLQKKVTQKSTKNNQKELYNRVSTLKVTPTSQAAFNLTQNAREQIFSTWTVSTGSYLSGNSKGKPRVPKRMQLNSACLLTHCPDGALEQDRKIIGAFMVKDDFEGTLCEDGIISSHEKYKIQLDDTELLPFWDYFTSEATVPKWGNMDFKYFPNQTMESILKDIQVKISDSERRQAAEEIYQYFLQVNKL